MFRFLSSKNLQLILLMFLQFRSLVSKSFAEVVELVDTLP